MTGTLRYNLAVRTGLAIITLIGLLFLPPGMKLDAIAFLLAIVAAIYVGFALNDGRPREVRTEITAAAGFVALALLGLWMTPWALLAGYVGHGVWDLLHHEHGIPTRVTVWYPPLCVAYDWILAGFVLVLILSKGL